LDDTGRSHQTGKKDRSFALFIFSSRIFLSDGSAKVSGSRFKLIFFLFFFFHWQVCCLWYYGLQLNVREDAALIHASLNKGIE
jgi:hypothetical protein